jgi:protein tyrosine phosphatase (PTP) superfamily phosphohydrolase (DUF442 family)/predicted small secreted protein
MKKLLLTVMAVIALACCTTSCTTQRGFPPDHQIVNFDKVDTFLYRGAQPNHRGFEFLKSVGIGCVANLRNDPLPDERATVTALGMHYITLPMSGVYPPSQVEMNRILDALDAQCGPVFIHCEHGCDRTGDVAAAWRIRKHGWSNRDALAEAIACGITPFLGFREFILRFK